MDMVGRVKGGSSGGLRVGDVAQGQRARDYRTGGVHRGVDV